MPSFLEPLDEICSEQRAAAGSVPRSLDPGLDGASPERSCIRAPSSSSAFRRGLLVQREVAWEDRHLPGCPQGRASGAIGRSTVVRSSLADAI